MLFDANQLAGNSNNQSTDAPKSSKSPAAGFKALSDSLSVSGCALVRLHLGVPFVSRVFGD